MAIAIVPPFASVGSSGTDEGTEIPGVIVFDDSTRAEEVGISKSSRKAGIAGTVSRRRPTGPEEVGVVSLAEPEGVTEPFTAGNAITIALMVAEKSAAAYRVEVLLIQKSRIRRIIKSE